MKTQSSAPRTTDPPLVPRRWRAAAAARSLPLLLLLLLPDAASAQFIFATNNGALTITAYTGSGGAVAIPSMTNGLPITSIGTNAFQSCSLGSVTIPNSVTNIGQWAFFDCAGLTNITIPNSVSNIGVYAFADCSSLASVTLPNGLATIGQGAFEFCDSLASVTIPSSATDIGDYAFYGCSSLTSIAIPNSVTNIGADAFFQCFSLTSVTIPNSVSSIGGGAFGWCSGLTNVNIPNSVTNIGGFAFGHCTSLSAINVSTNNPAYSSLAGVLLNADQTTLIQYPAGKAGSYTVPSSVASIATYAFYCCPSLTGVYFEGNAPSQGTSVFTGDKAVVYYLPGTTGWGTTFGGLPAVLWNPQAQTSGGPFGVQTNGFGFTITGTSNIMVVVQACTNLANPVWYPLQTNTLTGGSSYFSDPQWTNYPARFYRLRWP